MTCQGRSEVNVTTWARGTTVYSAYPPSNTRPMPPIRVATCCPGTRSPSGAASTTPTASIPSTRGNVTPWAYPRRVCSSERFRPKAITVIRTHPR